MKNISIEDVIKKGRNLDGPSIRFVKKAYYFARKAHKGQRRKTGEPYIIHPLYTAYYIADLGMGSETIAAALLHDVVEDCNVSEAKIKKEFGETVARLVKGVTKLRHTERQKITNSSVENLRRFFLVAAKDIRAVIIKLADRLHNARTIHGLTPERQKKYALEIKHIFSPLSEYLGIAYFKRQFDDIAFKILTPSEYHRINEYLAKHHKRRQRYIHSIEKRLERKLKDNKIKAKVYGREKSVYSLHRKIQRYLKEGKIHSEIDYGRIYDYFGFRILVKRKEECYRILGIVHSLWPPLNGHIKDYIANPKPNGYRSLHTTVFCDREKIAEIQIRTYKMHDYNEFGPASHIAYKRAAKGKSLPLRAYRWLRNIRIFKAEGDLTELSDKDYQVEIFKDNIFVLTPANEVKKLPKGGTPVDFAYAVHTDIGSKCRGAKVNGKMVPLDHELTTGDQVEIILDKNALYPIPGWLSFVVAPSTRAKIKYTLREKEEKEAIEKGLVRLNNALKKHNTSFKKLYKNRRNDIQIIINRYKAKDKNNFLARIGFNLINIDSIVSFLFPVKRKSRRRISQRQVVLIEGSPDTRYSIAKCCTPKEGDGIIALTTITRGIRIHRKDCPYIRSADPSRILTATWEE